MKRISVHEALTNHEGKAFIQDGRKVRILKETRKTDSVYYYIGLVDNDYNESVIFFDKEGESSSGSYRLCMTGKKIKIEKWVNVYRDGLATIHDSREIADNTTLNRFACIKVEFECEEGEGLT